MPRTEDGLHGGELVCDLVLTELGEKGMVSPGLG